MNIGSLIKLGGLGLALWASAGTAMARVGQVTQLSRRQHAMYKGGRSY